MKGALQVALGILTATGGFVDAGAIATAAGAGAEFGLGLVWAMLLGTFAIVLLVEQAGRLAAVSGKTYADGIRERFGFKFYLVPLGSDLAANMFMLAADLGGMAIAISLVTGLDWHLMLPVVALLVWLMVWRAPFGLIENGPALLGLLAFAFWAGIVALGGIPGELWTTLWQPRIEQGKLAEYLFLAAAILGAVISPYLLFFYSSGAREEHWSRRSLGINRATAGIGMGFGSTTAIALIVISAIVLGPLDIEGSTLPEIGLSMAGALGVVGALLFASVLFVTCLGAALEVVLSIGYNVAQGFGWEWGEEKKPIDAPRFNLLLTAFLVAGLLFSLVGLDPLHLALIGSAFTALVLPFSLAPFLVLMNDPDYLGSNTNGRFTNIATIAILVIAFVVALVSIPLLVATGG
ncbi:MAG: divalent metal cation transporter [Chloroflexota bacterium]|nr:divalent metal cation transporter [Chloroflexota bacterium]